MHSGAVRLKLRKSVLGLVPARSGRIIFDGIDITHMPTHLIARLGIAWVPDNRRIFLH
jgi:branched-chain amino acid transport system ATP-binding protein